MVLYLRKEEEREWAVEDSSLPDSGALKQASRLFERLFLGQRTLISFWKPQESPILLFRDRKKK